MSILRNVESDRSRDSREKSAYQVKKLCPIQDRGERWIKIPKDRNVPVILIVVEELVIHQILGSHIQGQNRNSIETNNRPPIGKKGISNLCITFFENNIRCKVKQPHPVGKVSPNNGVIQWVSRSYIKNFVHLVT